MWHTQAHFQWFSYGKLRMVIVRAAMWIYFTEKKRKIFIIIKEFIFSFSAASRPTTIRSIGSNFWCLIALSFFTFLFNSFTRAHGVRTVNVSVSLSHPKSRNTELNASESLKISVQNYSKKKIFSYFVCWFVNFFHASLNFFFFIFLSCYAI